MTTGDQPTFAAAVYTLGQTFDTEITPVKVEAYYDALEQYPLERVLLAIKISIRTCLFFPKPVELINLLTGTADDAWGEVLREVRRVGYTETPNFESPTVMATIEAVAGSWVHFCSILPNESSELIGWMKQFKAAYSVMTARHHQHTLIATSANPELLSAARSLADKKTFPG